MQEDMIDRLRWNYEAAPEVLHLPHGLERLRKAYEVYLTEEDQPVRFDEARRRLREWAA